MRSIEEIKANPQLSIQEIAEDGGYAIVYLNSNKPILVIFSWGGGWDHVSASYKHRSCTWEEMCRIKAMFFRDDECVVQYHPAQAEYVNKHPYCLHLWRPQSAELPTPPAEFV